MAELYTNNTFSEYATLVDVIQNGWKGLTLAKSLELLGYLDETKAKTLALYKIAKLAQTLELPEDTFLVKFEFKDFLNTLVAYPQIRRLEADYVIQIDNIPVNLMENRELFDIKPEAQTITSGKESYQVPSFVFTLPNESSTTDSFAVKSTFALKVDAVKDAEKKARNEDLLKLFMINPSAPSTMSLIEEFKSGSGYTLTRDLQPGLYPFNSFKIVEQSTIENGKPKKWKVALVECVDGNVINVSLNSEIGKFFGSDLAQLAMWAGIKKVGFATLFIREVETVTRKDGSVVHPVHGTVFNGEADKILQVRYSAENAALRSAELPAINGTPAPTVPQQTTVDIPAQSSVATESATNGKKKKTNTAVMDVKPLDDSDAPDFGDLL